MIQNCKSWSEFEFSWYWKCCKYNFNWNTPSNVGTSYSATGTGELGNYTTGPNYAITNIGTMAGVSKKN